MYAGSSAHSDRAPPPRGHPVAGELYDERWRKLVCEQRLPPRPRAERYAEHYDNPNPRKRHWTHDLIDDVSRFCLSN